MLGSVHSSVKNYYGKVLGSSKDLRTSACTASGSASPHPLIRQALSLVPPAVTERFYGCGNPVPLGIEGKDVLDLGCGSGRDCYVAAVLVGAGGSVTGVDMTEEQLHVARQSVGEFERIKNISAARLRFLHGYAEDLAAAGVADSSVDVCISNCVVNLSPDKPRVLHAVFRALRDGGELHIADICADAPLPAPLRTHPLLLGECLGGALLFRDFEAIAQAAGFARPRVVSVTHVAINDGELGHLVGSVNFFSITYRLFKLSDAPQTECRAVMYLGSVAGCEDCYVLDVDNTFVRDEPTA
ncbi:hypothetical protein EV174_005833, partial [Coemansia sp. RSA 2320]